METQSLDAKRLRALVSYDKITGAFTWLVDASRNAKAGAKAGSVRKDGYHVVRVDGVLYLGHRLAWLHTYGSWPAGKLDHKNGDCSDNRINNLREATDSANAQNKVNPQANNRSGYLGVSRKKTKWVAEIAVEGKKFRLGSYDTAAEASNAYQQFKKLLHVECLRLVNGKH